MSNFKSWFPNIYFETEKGIIINDDCFNVFKYIPDKSIDMILADLPYGITRNKWDVPIPLDKLWEQYSRIIKDNGVIVLFGNQPFTSMLVMSNLKYFRYALVWGKNRGTDFLNAKRKPLKIHEDILVFYKTLPKYNPQYMYDKPYKRWCTQQAVDRQTNYGKYKAHVAINNDGKRYPTTVLKFNKVERALHPTQKPVELCEYLIKTYTNEGYLVLDNTAGVCSTGVAAENTNRRWICIEKEKEYCDKAITRFA